MKGYEFLPEAEEEMNEAARFYERRKEGLGLEFLNEVQRTITSILAHPQSGQFRKTCAVVLCVDFRSACCKRSMTRSVRR